MGSSIRRFTGQTKMNRLTALLFVAAAKAEFKAAFDMAEAGEHIQLAPVNNDVQAEQIANAYMAESKAAFDDAAAGGLAAKQAPAPVHTIPIAAHYAAYPYLTSYPYAAYPYAHHVGAYPYAHHVVGAYPYAHHVGAYPYALPVLAASNVVKSE